MKKNLLIVILLLLTGIINAQTPVEKSKQDTNTYVKHINKADFLKYVYNYEKNPQKWTLEGNLPCIIDFYEPWCGPCRMIAPILEELAKEYNGKIIIYKVNTQNEIDIKTYFRINRFPTLFFCRVGNDPLLVIGAQTKEKFKELIEVVLLNNNNYQSQVQQ